MSKGGQQKAMPRFLAPQPTGWVDDMIARVNTGLELYAGPRPNRAIGPAPRNKTRLVRSDFAKEVEGLTGWQRNQWARAGYPGLRHENLVPLRPFLEMVKR